jgi:hypothetical protein
MPHGMAIFRHATVQGLPKPQAGTAKNKVTPEL